MTTDKQHSEAELRGMITGRQNEIEQIMVRCARVGFDRAAEELEGAIAGLIAAKCALVQESREQEVRAE
jgi:hypothetical protein